MPAFKKHLLSAVVFLTGGAVLVLEVTATRVLAPYFGNTIYAVSGILGVILAALSVGYYYGGRLADRRPEAGWFYGLIFFGGLSVIFLELIKLFLLPSFGRALPLSYGPLLASLILFFLPAALLGMLSPYAIKLRGLAEPNSGVGAVSGEIFFYSTLGSIAGSLLTGFVLIPNFGVDKIIISTGLMLCFLGLGPLIKSGGKKIIIFFILAACLAGANWLILNFKPAGMVYQSDGVYEKLIIYDGSYRGRPTRFFQQDLSNSGAMYLDGEDLVYDYTKYYALYKILTPALKRALVIGGGAYSLPKALLKEPGIEEVTVAEIEPSLVYLAKKYFRLPDDPRLKNQVADGRRLLQANEKKYDLIFSDVYYSLYSIPVQFTTEEFFRLAKSRLSRDGVFFANLIGRLDDRPPSLILSEIKTFQAVFPKSYVFAVSSPNSAKAQNLIFLGYNGERQVDFKSPEIKDLPDKIVANSGGQLVDLSKIDFSRYAKLTDDFAPVEYLTAKVLD